MGRAAQGQMSWKSFTFEIQCDKAVKCVATLGLRNLRLQ